MNGYFTTDGLDLNELWYGAMSAADMYKAATLPILDQMIRFHDLSLMKYYIAEKNGYEVIALDTKPGMKKVKEAALYAPLPLKFGYGVGAGLDSLRLSTGRQVMANIDRGFKEDAENLLIQIMRKLMTDPGTLNAGFGLFNGEFSAEEQISAPPQYGQNVFLANHNHYYTSGATTIDLGDITAAKQTIRHHGYKGKLVAMINSSIVMQLENLAAFTANQLTRSPISDQVAVMGFTDQFTLLGVEWYASEAIPDNYFIMAELAEGDDDRMIVQFEPPQMRGLRLMPGPVNDYPLVESFFERFGNWKVWRRGAAVVVQLTASATFVSPTLV